MSGVEIKGMRFWLMSTVFAKDRPQYKSHDPFAGEVSIARFPNLSYGGKPLEIHGEAWIDDKEIIIALITSANSLRFDPQHAVDLGYLSVEEMANLGFKTVPSDAKQKPSKPAEMSHPNWGTISIAELREWADTQGIYIPARISKDDAIKLVKTKLSEKKNGE